MEENNGQLLITLGIDAKSRERRVESGHAITAIYLGRSLQSAALKRAKIFFQKASG